MNKYMISVYIIKISNLHNSLFHVNYNLISNFQMETASRRHIKTSTYIIFN